MNAVLTQFAFIREMSPAGQRELSEHLTLSSVRPGQVLISKGDRVSGAYLVQSGSLRVYELGPTGREQTLYWAGAGQSCIHAVNCVFSDVRYPAWVEVDDEEALVGVVEAEAYRRLFASEPALQRFTFDVLARQVIELTEALAEAGTLDLEQRVIHLLLRRCDEASQVNLSQERIARHVGSVREVVSRTLRTLASLGLIKNRRGGVDILDFEGLELRMRR